MTPVLLIGDSGLLGQALLAHARKLELPVRGASRRSADLKLDALDPDALEKTLDAVQPGTLINAAGLIDVNRCELQPDEAWRANARLPARLADACTRRGIRLVHISTDHFFSGDQAAPHPENATVTLVNEYARSKYAGECLALTCRDALVVRTNIVGFRGWPQAPTFVEWLLDALENATPIRLFSDFHTSSIAASQFAAALFSLLQHPLTGLIHLAARQGSSKLQFTEALAAACHLSTQACSPGSVADLHGVRRAESLVLDVSRAEKLLGAPLPDLAAVVQQLAVEYRERKAQTEKPACVTPP